MARVNIEQQAFIDPRFALLGKIIGRDRHSALGRMSLVWNLAQERNTYVLPAELLDSLFDDVTGFAAAIIASGLGVMYQDAGVYICGTRGRIEWLAIKRDAARRNGSKSRGRPKKTEVEPIENQRGFPAENPPALAPALAPAPAPALKANEEHTTATGSAGVLVLPTDDGGAMLPMAEAFDRTAAFRERWESYPRKENRARAESAFRRTVKTRANLAAHDRALDNYRAHCATLEDEKFIMQGGTWFGGRWQEWANGNPRAKARKAVKNRPGGANAGSRIVDHFGGR